MASGDLTLKPITVKENEGLTAPARAEQLTISPDQSSFAGADDTNITIVDESGKAIEFRYLDTFPYLDPINIDVPPSDEDTDFNTTTKGFEAYIEDYTLASDRLTNDGSVTVGIRKDGGQALSFYSYGIKYSSSQLIPLFQSSSSFSNLYPGEYTFIVRSGLQESEVQFSLGHKEDAEFNNTVYGEKYSFEFNDAVRNPSNTQQYKVSIYQRDYSGGVTTVTPTGTPAVYSMRGEGNDVYQNTILPSQLNISLYCTNLQYIEFARANDKDYQAVFQLWNGSSYDEIWRGYVLPRSFTEEYGNNPHTCSFQASDMLADLSNRDYISIEDDINNALKFYGGDRSALQIIRFCLEQLGIALPFRVAIDVFEDSQDSTSSDTPLEQTYVDTDSYFTDLETNQLTKRFIPMRADENLLFVENVSDSMNMADVIRALLRPFKAQLLQWGGYYYIVDSKQWLNSSSISYVEFDNTGTQTGTGSFSHIVDFKRPTESTRFRWEGGLQSLTTTETYGIINLIYKTKPRPSIITQLTSDNAKNSAMLNNYSWYPSQNIGRVLIDEQGATVTRSTSTKKEPIKWRFTQYQDKITDSFIETAVALDHGSGDVLELNYKLNIDLQWQEENFSLAGEIAKDGSYRFTLPPYFIFEYQIIKISANSNTLSYYNEAANGFQDTTAVNQKFMDSAQGDFTIRANLNVPSIEGDRYVFRTFIPNVYNADFNNPTPNNDLDDAITAGENVLKAIDTVNLPYGTRQIGAFIIDLNDGNGSYPSWYKAYELQQNPSGASVTPDDYNASTNNKRWKVIADWFPPSFGASRSRRPIWTITTFSDISAKLLPDGKEVKDEIVQSRTINKDNTLTLNYDLYHYDAPVGVKSADVLFNSFFDSNRNVTSNWTEDGVTKTLNELLLDWLQRLAIQARLKISGQIITDVAFSPLKVLRDPDDDNRVFLPHGTSIDFRQAGVSGEFVEIGADTIPGVSDWLAADWNTSDFKTT